MPNCRRLDAQTIRKARFLALANAGNNIDINIAIMVSTTSNSVRVNADDRCGGLNEQWMMGNDPGGCAVVDNWGTAGLLIRG